MSLGQKFNLDGKTALVTGCKRGIGKAMAVGLAGAGADIIGVSVSMPDSGSEVEKEVSDCGRKFTPMRCDFSDRQGLYGLIERVKDEFPVIDILVNNAGICLREPAANHSDEMYDEVVEVNQNAQFILTREIGRDMVERGAGKVVFTASLLTFQGGITVPSYAASKGAIGQLTMAFANEWASHGVNVNAIAPGYIHTDLTEALINDPNRSKAILDRIPAARWGRPEDFAGPIVFLCSEAASYVNGTILVVDGGWMGR